MRTIISVIGILLIIYGVVALGYNGFTYSSREKVAEIGSLQVTAETEKQVYLSPTAGGIALIAGVIVLALGRLGKKD